MEQFLTAESLISLLTLVLMEIILGIDNVIFVSIVLNRLPADKRPAARRVWMFAGMAIRIVLLLCIGYIVKAVHPLFTIGGHGFSLRDLIMLGGGLFLLIKTTLEIHHKLEGEENAQEQGSKKAAASFLNIVGQIIIIDTVFSFDSIITAVGLARQIPIMIIAVIIAMIIMFLFAPRISDFIHKHPTLKMLALSFLVMVGAILIIEGWNAEQAHEMHLKNYVYFAMAFSFGVELLNMRASKSHKSQIAPKEEESKRA
ncbi:TerC family protein [Chitinophaga silvatica]|uniref:TerC family protein n=1 Tax=Chitinophaga silvatica TaxID=2282649 RepID=A0A3E1YAV1_9BACT|nr:TerC family protein [Chitinophaga silvatica]RFS22766.1 TerC family protein [Chitinophaga silvatica]